MRQNTKRRAAKNRVDAGIRRSLVARFEDGGCWVCGASSKRPNLSRPISLSKLCCHELGACNSGLRAKSQGDVRFLLVVCFWCNQNEVGHKGKWPEARQLMLKKLRDPLNYARESYLHFTRPNAPDRITEAEVEAWRDSMPAARPTGRYPDWRTL